MHVLDEIRACPYCGEIMNGLTEEQMAIFGRPMCCGYEMVSIDRGKLHMIVRALDKLKEKLEQVILEGLI